MVKVKEFDGMVRTFGLTRVREVLLSHARQSLRLRLNPDVSDGVISRLGGEPDVPENFEWPESEGLPLSFIGQIALADLTGTIASEILPRQGLLSFFYEADQQPWGFDPKDGTGFKIFLWQPSQKLIRKALPGDLEEHCKFEPVAVTFEDELTFPEQDASDGIGLNYEEQERYFEFCMEWYGDTPIHRLLGHPQLVQGDWRLECELASNGVYVGDPSGYDSARGKELASGANAWRLLLQIDTDEQLGMIWGDEGRLYFCVNESSLSAKDFSKTWTILQCY